MKEEVTGLRSERLALGGLLGGGGMRARSRRLKRNFQAAKAKKHISGSRIAW